MPQDRPIIEAKESNVRDLLKNKFYKIPIYQRPFSWGENNFRELVDDIMDAIEGEQPNYFLGSLILKEESDGLTYEIVDGQQRLTSLVVLFAVLRDNFDRGLHKWVMEEGDEYAGIPSRERIKVWDDLREFFSEYIYTPGGTKRFLEDFEAGRIPLSDKDSPVYHLYEAIKTFEEFARDIDPNTARRFLNYLFTSVYFVRIVTTDRSSAFRLFNVINTRGLPLSAADVLKSMNLEPIPEDRRERYFRMWRDLEEDIGREKLEILLNWIRTIYAEEKAKRNLVDEFESLFKSGYIRRGEEFFKVVIKYGEIYRDKVLDPELSGVNAYQMIKYTTLMDLMNRFLPFSEWVAPLMFFHKKFRDDESLYTFAFKLEKKLFVEWCADFTATERVTSAVNLIRLIKTANSPDDVFNTMFSDTGDFRRGRKGRVIGFENPEEVKAILLSKLNDPQFYSLKGGKLARYLLLRVDMELQEENFPGYANIGTITVEHILPRTLSEEWLEFFSEDDAKAIVNKLGNLALLNRRKNSRASNYGFKKKLERYFDVTRTPFAITAMLRDYPVWNKHSFERRHSELLKRALDLYLPV